MTNANGNKSWSFGSSILWHRQPIGLALAIITVFMAIMATRVQIATRFEDLFPATHPNVRLYREFRRQYGGAQTLILMLRVKDGDIFNIKTLEAVQGMTRDVDKLPGVNHNEVFSLASYRVLYARALPGALVSTPYMYPNVPKSDAELKELRENVMAHRDQLAAYVTHDMKGALVIASFNEQNLDYKALFDGVETIIHRYENPNTIIYASGATMFAAWGYHYLSRIGTIFLVSIALMLLLTFLTLGRRTGWWVPVLTGICSAIWGLGFVSLMGFNFDPVMLVIPFILTARDFGHGIQWQGRYYDELERNPDKIEACTVTADRMFAPGILAVLANVIGIICISVSDIPVLKQIGFGGAVWLGASVAMVFVFQPIIASILPRPQVRAARATRPGWLARIPVTQGPLRAVLMIAGVVLIAIGVNSSRHALIGYQTPGTPIYRMDAKVNQDTAVIGQFVPTNMAWVIVETPNYPNPLSNLGIVTLRITDDLAAYLMSRGDALAVLGFGNLADRPMNMLLHNGFPKYLALPDSDALSANLWGFFFGASAPDEPQAYFAFSPSMTNSCVRVLLPDHTNARLNRLRADLDTFVRERLRADPALNPISLHYLGGDAGLYQATDDVISRLNFVNLGLVLVGILLCCMAVFRSVLAGVIFAVACIMANLVAFVFMNASRIGLTVDTLPIISLGIGLGIDYAIYTVARMRDEMREGLSLDDATTTALHTTGKWVVAGFIVMVGGIVPWIFSPLLFHNEMSVLIILLMVTNLIVGLLVVPSFIAWIQPRFMMRNRGSAAGGDEMRQRAVTPAAS